MYGARKLRYDLTDQLLNPLSAITQQLGTDVTAIPREALGARPCANQGLDFRPARLLRHRVGLLTVYGHYGVT
jgi:hypothetical protein